MGHSWISVAGWFFLAATCALAWLKGAKPEKLGSGLLLAINVASDLVIALSYPHTPQLVMFSLDLVLAIGLLALAIRFSSLWLGAAMILQSIALLAHGARLGGEGVDTYTWMVLNNVISQAMQLCLVGAALMSWRARRSPKGSAFHFIADPA